MTCRIIYSCTSQKTADAYAYLIGAFFASINTRNNGTRKQRRTRCFVLVEFVARAEGAFFFLLTYGLDK